MLHLYLYLQSYLWFIMGAWFHIQEDPMQKYYKKWGQYKCLLRWIVFIDTVRKLIKYIVNLQSIQWHAKKEPKSSFLWICYFWKYTLSQSPSRRTCSSNFLISIIIQTLHWNLFCLNCPSEQKSRNLSFLHGNEAIFNFSEEVSLSHNSRLEKDVPLGLGDSSVIAAVIHPAITIATTHHQ